MYMWREADCCLRQALEGCCSVTGRGLRGREGGSTKDALGTKPKATNAAKAAAKITWSWLLESELSCCRTLGMALTMRFPTSSTLMFLMAPVA